MALRGLRKGTVEEKLEEAIGWRADCSWEEEVGVEFEEEEDGMVGGAVVIGDIVMCGAGKSLS